MALLDVLREYAQTHGGVIRLGTNNDLISELHASNYDISESRVHNLLAEMVRDHVIRRPSHGIYLVPDAFGRVSRWAAASEIGGDGAFVSMWSAAEFHNLTTSQTGWISVITSRRQAEVDLNELGRAIFHTTDAERMFGAVETVDGSVYARIAKPERLLLDLLLFSDTLDAPSSPQIYEIWQAAARVVNPALLVEYARRMSNARLARRTGFLMEHLGLPGHDALLAHRGPNKVAIEAIPGRSSVGLGSSSKWRIRD